MFWWILFSILIAYLCWTGVQYWGHRWWHYMMYKIHRNIIVEGEAMHHKFYDNAPPDGSEDEMRVFISFPVTYFWLLAIMLTIPWAIFVGPWAALSFACSATIFSFIDDAVHKEVHTFEYIGKSTVIAEMYEKKRGKFTQWLIETHRVHHATHTCNFAFFLGYPWDKVFGTFLSAKKFKGA